MATGNPTDLMNDLLAGKDMSHLTGSEDPAAAVAEKTSADTQEQNVEEEVSPKSALEGWEDDSSNDGDGTEEEVDKPTDGAEQAAAADKPKATSKKDLEVKVKNFHKGMRKFQKERDAEIAKNKELQEKVNEQEALWSKVERAAGSQDFNELMKIMTAGKMDFDTYLEQRLEKSRLREDATEEELEKMDLQDQLSEVKNQLARQREEMDEKLGKVKGDLETTELNEVKSIINPIFNKYRFHGKLGDKDAELKLDSMLFNHLRSSLKDYDSITNEVVEKEMRSSVEFLNKVIDKKVDTNANKVSKKRKKTAKEAAQVQHVRGYVASDAKKEASEKIKSGNLVDVLKNWNKYGKLF